MTTSAYSYSSSFGPSITDCQEVFNLSQYTPEQIVDAVFNSQSNKRFLSKEEFKQAFRAAFERNVSNTKGFSVDACVDKIFTSCVFDGSSINADKLGKSIAIFTQKREPTTNPIQSLYFVLDRNYKGVVTEDELQAVIREVRDPSTAEAIRANFSSFKDLIVSSSPSRIFQLSYWDLYANRSHIVVQKLLEAQKQIHEKRYSTSPLKSSGTTSSGISVNPIFQPTPVAQAYVNVPAGTYGAVPNTTISYTTSTSSPGIKTQTYTTDSSSLANKIQSTNVTQGTSGVKVTSSPYRVDDELRKSFTLFGEGVTRPQEIKQVTPQPQSPGYVFADVHGVHHANITGRNQDTVIEHRQTRGIRSFQEFLELKDKLGFNLIGAHEAILAIRERIGHVAQLTLDDFIIVFTDMFRGKFHNYYEFIDKLAQIFYFIDLNNNGVLEIIEILQAFVHLFGGTQEDKIKAVFHLFDLDGNGFLDQNEIYNLILNTIRLSQANVEGSSEVSFEKIAFATTQDLFNTIDLNHDEKISIDEFLIWYQTSGGEIDTEELERAKAIREAKMKELAKRGAIPAPKRDQAKAEAQALRKELEETGAFTRAIDNVRNLIPFQKIHIHVAVQLLIDHIHDKTCNIHVLVSYLKELLKITQIEGEDKIGKVARMLFNALDDNRNGLLELSELVTGLSLLCGGTQTEKLRAGFDLFDANSDKTLDFGELCQYMKVFFKLMSSDTPYEKLANGNANTFAYALALKAFEETKTPLQAGLQFDTLREWVQSTIEAK